MRKGTTRDTQLIFIKTEFLAWIDDSYMCAECNGATFMIKGKAEL